MPRIYATVADWPDAPNDAVALLRVASGVVDVLLRGRVYDTDDSAMPTAAGDVTAMRDATLALAKGMDSSGALSGTSGGWQSLKIGSLSLTAGADTAASSGVTVQGVDVPLEALVALEGVGYRSVTSL